METRIGGLFAGLVLGGSSAVGGVAVVGAGLYAAGYLVARLGRRTHGRRGIGTLPSRPAHSGPCFGPIHAAFRNRVDASPGVTSPVTPSRIRFAA